MRELQRAAICVLFGGVCLLAVVIGGCPPRERATEIRIGCITPLTGEHAAYGKETKRGVDLAVEELNAAGGVAGKEVSVVYEDDQMTARMGTAALQKLITVDKVPVVLGAFGSRVTLAIAPIAERHKVVLFSASSTADAIADAGDYIFRNVPTNAAQGMTAALFALQELDVTTACVLQVNDDYGRSLADAFRNAFQPGGSIVSTETYNPGAKDFRAQLTRIRERKPDVVFSPTYYQEMGLILKQATELGLSCKWIGGDGAVSPELIEIARNTAESTYYTMMGTPLGDPDTAAFETSFRDRYGEAPPMYSAYAYDAVMVIADAVRRGGYSADGIKQALYATEGFKGATGVMSFDDRGEVNKQFSVAEVVNGEFKTLPWHE